MPELEKSTVSRFVDQLEASDLATRSPNPSDRRSVLVALTHLEEATHARS